MRDKIVAYVAGLEKTNAALRSEIVDLRRKSYSTDWEQSEHATVEEIVKELKALLESEVAA